MTPTEFLTQNKACKTKRDYAMGFKTMVEVWGNCPRGDWLLWILQKLRITPERELRLFACWCAEQAQPTDPRSLTAIAVARRYAMGEATLSELQEAYAAAEYASYASAACAAAEYAAYAAAEYEAKYAERTAEYAAAAVVAARTAVRTAVRTAGCAACAAAAACAACAAETAEAADAANAAYAAAQYEARQAQASHFRTLVKNPFL